MAEPALRFTEPITKTTKPARRRLKVTDIIIVAVMAIIIIMLGITLQRQLSLKHEVYNAKATASRILTDLQKQNAGDIHNSGDKAFQASHSVAQLQTLTQNATGLVTGTPDTAQQIVTNNKFGQKVAVIYKFNSKTPFYVSIVVNKLKGDTNWHLIGLSGSTNQTDLAK